MKFLNSMDIDDLRDRFGSRSDDIGRMVRILAALRDDVDDNSDGWAHWAVPVRAARQLIVLIERHARPSLQFGAPIVAITPREVSKAVAAVRAFYTRAHRGDYGGPFPATNRYLE